MTTAERKVKERYPDCEPALLVGYGWEIFQDRSEEAPIIGKARGMLENAWRDAASRLDTESGR